MIIDKFPLIVLYDDKSYWDTSKKYWFLDVYTGGERISFRMDGQMSSDNSEWRNVIDGDRPFVIATYKAFIMYLSKNNIQDKVLSIIGDRINAD